MKTFQFSCVACGASLQVADAEAGTHVSCQFCAHDNILPKELLQHREQLERHAQQADERARKRAQDGAEERSVARRVALVVVLLLITCVGLPLAKMRYDDKQEQARQARFAERRKDPAYNGQTWVGERVRDLQAQRGCKKILVQPTTAMEAEATAAAQVPPFGGCVHLVAGTGFGTQIMVSNGSTATTREVPTSSSFIDNRFCPMGGGELRFGLIGASETAFTYALVECPRQPAETGSRANLADPATTGEQKLLVLSSRLRAAGCTTLDTPTVKQGGVTLSVHSDKGAGCVHIVAASGFDDVELRPELVDPQKTKLPVPPARGLVQAAYCPNVSGSFQMTIWPSSRDHFTTQLFSCDRAGREGLARENEIKAVAR